MTERLVYRAAVFIIVRDELGRMLLQQRQNTGYMDGYYDFPSGHVEANESFTAAAVRELAEEVVLTVAEADLRVVHLNQNYSDVPYINVVFAAEKWEGTPCIGEPEKCSDQQFFAVNDLPEKCSLAVRYVEQAGFETPFATSYVDREVSMKLTGWAAN